MDEDITCNPLEPFIIDFGYNLFVKTRLEDEK